MAETSKRKRSIENDSDFFPPKRLSTGQSLTAPSISYGDVDPTYGQRSAFPGLDDNGSRSAHDADVDLEDDVTPDAISYLKGVRTEARSIPTLLVAPRNPSTENEGPDRSLYDNGVGDSRGWYRDGAYTAAPRQELTYDPFEDEGSEQPQAVYYRLLMHRFSLLRKSLQRLPPPSVLENLDSNHGFILSPTTPNYRLWQWRLQKTDPILAQLAAMDKTTVLRLIELILQRDLLRKGKDMMGALGMIRTSMWIWGLLARLPEQGELGSEEVASVRELGKEAVWVGMQVRGMNVEGFGRPNEASEDDNTTAEEDTVDLEVDRSDEQPEVLEGDFGDDNPPVPLDPDRPGIGSDEANGAAQDLAAARTRLLARLNEQAIETERQIPSPIDEDSSRQNSALSDGPRTSAGREDGEPKGNDNHAKALLNIRATIDMIITVAGDMYGQRDLLQFRQLWVEEANGDLLGK